MHHLIWDTSEIMRRRGHSYDERIEWIARLLGIEFDSAKRRLTEAKKAVSRVAQSKQSSY